MILDQLLQIALVGSVWVLYLLLALSVLSLGAAAERFLYFRRHRGDPQKLRRDLAAALQAGDLHRAEKVLLGSRSVEARVVKQALTWRRGGRAAVSDAIDSELGAARRDLERGLNFLGTLGSNAPFIGLLGTVLGVIEAFHHLSAGGANTAAMGNVMAAIAEALIATGVGLFVAIPAVVAYNLAHKRIGEIEAATTSLGKLVTAWIETGSSANPERDAEPALAGAE